MWGALILLLLFLVIDPTTREVILSGLDDARLRLAVEAPLPYFMLIIFGGSALVSALIMKFWPRVENRPTRVRVMRRYQGLAQAELARMPQAPALGFYQLVAAIRFVVPVRARMACVRLMRHLGSFAGWKRLLGV